MHAVLGDGTMPSKELKAHLDDMSARAEADAESFWFLIQAKAEPTETDQALVAWLTDNEVYFETISDDKAAGPAYAESQVHHVAKKLAPKLIEVMDLVRKGGGDDENEPEESRLLGLFASDDPDAEEDRWLNDVVFAVSEAGYKVYALNDGMAEIDLEDAEGDVPMEQEQITMTVDLDSGEVTEKPNLSVVPDLPKPTYTRAELEAMDLTAVKKLAEEAGITLPPRTRFPTYVKALLGEDEAPAEAEVTPPEPEGGTMDGELQIQDPDLGGVTVTRQYADTNVLNPVQSGAAMLIIVANGFVTSRVITNEQAASLITATL